MDNKVWNELIAEVDQNGDGEIQFSEFQYMMEKLIQDEDLAK